MRMIWFQSLKKISCLILVLVLCVSVVPVGNLSANAAEPTHTITGFPTIDIKDRSLTFRAADKPSLSKLLSLLPDTMPVYLDGQETLTEIPVSYECVGMDYQTTKIYYYQFNPVWDTEQYQLSNQLDDLTDLPYYSIFLESGGGAIKLTTSTVTETVSNEDTIFNFLTAEMDYNRAAACGVLANICAESDFSPTAGGDTGTSHGICQWHNSRWTSLAAWCKKNGYDEWSIEGQLNYLKYELSQNDVNVLYNGKIINTTMLATQDTRQGAYEAGVYWCVKYEVPANKETVSVTRGNLARDTYWPRHPKVVKKTASTASTSTQKALSGGMLTLAFYSCSYNGKARKPSVTMYDQESLLTKGVDYNVAYKNNTKAGTASVVVTGIGKYKGTITEYFTIKQVKQPMTVTKKTKTVKYSKVKKKKQVVSKAIVVSNAKGKVTYKKVTSGSSARLAINKSTGKITVKKGTKKGTYKIKVKVTAAGNTNYKAGSKTVTVKVKVK